MTSEDRIQLSHDEIKRFEAALRDENFRTLLTEYAEELKDPANRKIYEEQLTAFEAENGVDAVFVTPEPGYVLKTKIGTRKIFINICKTDKAGEPVSEPSVKGNKKGINWSLPYVQAPGRADKDASNNPCYVYDVMFHPNTYHLLSKYDAIKRMVEDMAMEAVEKITGETVTRTGLKRPKLSYKGTIQPSIIRRTKHDFDGSNKEVKTDNNCDNSVIIPNYSVKYQSFPSIQNYMINPTEDSNCKVSDKNLLVDIDLPQLDSTSDTVLDVKDRKLTFKSFTPVVYDLDLILPCDVNSDAGEATFDKDKHVLSIKLPIVNQTDSTNSSSLPEYKVNYFGNLLEVKFISLCPENVSVVLSKPEVLVVKYYSKSNFSALIKLPSPIKKDEFSYDVTKKSVDVKITGSNCKNWNVCSIGLSLDTVKEIILVSLHHMLLLHPSL